MRISVSLEHPDNQMLPINYTYLISAWIYRTLAYAEPEFASWLHQQGYGVDGKHYKLFTFGPLKPARYAVEGNRFVLVEGPTRLELSFLLDEPVQHFVIGLFSAQSFSLGDRDHRVDFRVHKLDILNAPRFRKTHRYRLSSPLCLSAQSEQDRYAQYLHPSDEQYGAFLIRNLLRKGESARILSADIQPGLLDWGNFHFQLLSEPRAKLIHIKDSKIKGYLFDFELTAPEALHRTGYFAGFGEKNAQGFGLSRFLNA